MNRYSFTKHRLLHSIDEAYVNKGLRRIFLKGNALTDLFLWNLREGCYPLVDSLRKYAASRSFVWFINVDKQGQLTFWKIIGNNYVESSYNDFILKKLNAMAILMSKSNRDQSEATAADEVAASLEEQSEEVVQFNAVVDSLLKEQNRGNTLLHIEDFDWFAGFYSDEREHGKVRKLQLLENCKQHLVVASFRDLTILQDVFRFQVEGEHAIPVGEPSKEEIEMALTRICWREINHVPRALELDMLATQMSAAGYSLKQCIAVTLSVLNDQKEHIQLKDFTFVRKVEEEIYWEDVFLNESTKSSILETVEAFLKGDESARKGLLFTGPPGTGKTMIAKALANEAKMYFVAPNLSELKGEYIGQSAPKVRELFEKARSHEPSIIFLDEVDTLFPARGGSNGDSYTVDMVNEFLTQLDGATTGIQRIFVVAATNRVQLLDSAVRSRLGDPIEIGLPEKEERERLFKKHLPKLTVSFWEQLNYGNKQMLEIRSKDMSGRDIKIFCNDLANSVRDEAVWWQSNVDANLFFDDRFGIQFGQYRKRLIEELSRSTGVQFKRPIDLQGKSLHGCEAVLAQAQPYFDEIREDSTKKVLRSERYKLLPKRGILFYGPPGNGKTDIVSDLAHENGFYLVKVESKDLITSSERSILDRLDDIFRHVIRLSRVCDDKSGIVLFFDEIDALAGPHMTSSVRGTLLGILADKTGIRHAQTKVVLIAATNYKEMLDEAAIRKGRFDEHILITNPEKIAAIKILKSILDDKRRNMVNETSEETLISLYDQQNANKQEQVKHDFALRNRDLSLYKPDLYELELTKEIANCRLSGAEIRDLAEDLIRSAFEEAHASSSADSEIVINDELVQQIVNY